MPSEISQAAIGMLHEQFIPAFTSMLDEASPLDDAAALEHLAATLLVALEQPEMPGEAGSAVLGAIEARRDAEAAGVCAALAVIAAEPLAAQALASAQRLGEEGIVSPAAAELGALVVEKAVRIDGPGAELLVGLLRRPGASDVQAAVLAIEHEETGGALVECGLMPPAPAAEARELLRGIDGAPPPVPVSPEELTTCVVAAARRAVDAEVAVGHEAAPALAILSRALTGDPTGLPRPVVWPPWEDDDEDLVVDAAEDEEGFERVVETLLDELEQHAKVVHPPGGAVWEHGDFVASTMLEWKGGYGDGRLGHWTEDDLAEYLLDYFPRKVTVPPETLDAVPECVQAFLGFLEARGSLSGSPLGQLERACEALRDEFRERAGDRSGWGPAKAMVMQMLAEGVDPHAPGAMDAWVESFNDRPYEQRDAIVGPAVDRMADSAGLRPPAAPKAAGQQRTQSRKAQRTARKRNRRR